MDKQRQYKRIYQLIESKLEEISNGPAVKNFFRERRTSSFKKNASKGDNYLFSRLVACMFYGGFNSKTVEKKWPNIAKAFYGFDIAQVTRMSDAELNGLKGDQKVIRYKKKLSGVVENAKRILQIQKEHGSFASFIGQFKDSEALIASLTANFSYMGPATARDFIKDIGIDMIKPDVQVVKVMWRLGLLSSNDATKKGTIREVVEIGKEFSKVTGERLSVIDGAFWLYGADRAGKETVKNICAKEPLCPECMLRNLCTYYRAKSM